MTNVMGCSEHASTASGTDVDQAPGTETPQSQSSKSSPPAKRVVKEIMWCWDKSEQKLRRFRTRSSQQLVGAGASSAQILVQCGRLAKFMLESGVVSKHAERMFVRPRRLQHTTTDFIIEGVSRGLPVYGGIDNFVELFSEMPTNELLVVAWFFLGCDRAIQNWGLRLHLRCMEQATVWALPR